MTRIAARSPAIARLGWGDIAVDATDEYAQEQQGKDFKLYPGGARPWDWRETGTSHVPGIQPADVRELLDAGVSVVVLSRGMQSRLQVDPQTVQLLEAQGIPAHIHETRDAADIYNRLAATERVGGLFHSTC